MKKTILFFFSLICMQSLFAYEMRDEVKLEPLCGEEITFEAQAETGYHFLYWSDGVTDPIRTFTPEQSADYIAYFEIDTCIVIFYNSDNTILKKDTLKFGENVYDNRPADPTIPESQKEPGHEYAFNGWNPTLSPDYTVPEKTDTLKYYATYSDIMLSYTIHFINWDNTPIKDITLQYGSQIDTCKQVPGYDGQNKPTKPENDTCSFTFKGWDPDITGAIVTGEATYMALYDTIYNLFTVTVAIDPAFGEVSKTPGQYEGDTYHFGDSVEITVTNIDVCYQFKQWIYTGTETQFTNEMTYKFAVTKNMDLTAILERIKYVINVKTNNSTQGKVGGQVNN